MRFDESGRIIRNPTRNRILNNMQYLLFGVIILLVMYFFFKDTNDKDEYIAVGDNETLFIKNIETPHEQPFSEDKVQNNSIPLNINLDEETSVEGALIDSDLDGVIDTLDQCPNTAMHIVINDQGCPKLIKIVDTLEMKGQIFFDIDSSYIKGKYLSDLEKIADKMREYPTSTLVVEGHAASKDVNSFNEDLAEMRAYNVMKLFIEDYKIDSSHITAKNYGSSRPIAPNNTRVEHEMNSRVDIYVEGEKIQIIEQTKDMKVQH